MPDEHDLVRQQAARRFDDARRQARRDQLRAWLSGRDDTLIPFHAIREELNVEDPRYCGLRQVPIDQIVGSVGRYRDFTRQFLPLRDSLRDRWIRLEALARRRGWPPVELYRVGEAYFVRDGNHRVAIARQMDNDTIEAHVWDFPEAAELSPEASLDAFLIRLEAHNFMARTGLAERYPAHEIALTTPGRYQELLAQIHRVQRVVSTAEEREVPLPEAAGLWYEEIFRPGLDLIRDADVLSHFPGRTAADLYVWLSATRLALRERYGEFDGATELVEQVASTQEAEGKSMAGLVRRVMRLLGRPELPPLEEIDTEGNVHDH